MNSYATSFLVSVIVAQVFNCCMCAPADRIMCYFHSSARHRTTLAKFEITNINFTLCTHYIYAYARINTSTKMLVPADPSEELGPKGLYRQFNNGKRMAPSIKTLLAVESPRSVYDLASDHILATVAESIGVFAKSAVSLLTLHGFDGLDIDWPFPESVPEQFLHAAILKTLNSEIILSRGRLILTASAKVMSTKLDTGYLVKEIAKYVDFTILHTHRIIFPEVTFAYFHGPLFGKKAESNYRTMSMSQSVRAWGAEGMPFNKIVVGMSAVATILQLSDHSQWEPGSYVTGDVMYGPLYNMSSSLAYPEVCMLMTSSLRHFDPVQRSPYLVRGSTWVGYEDHESIQAKLDWLSPLDVGGVMFAALDEDDFTGQVCGEGRYPLLTFIKWAGQSEVTPTTLVTLVEERITYTTKTGRSGLTDDKRSDNLMVHLLLVFIFILVYLVAAVCVCRTFTKTELPPARGEDHTSSNS
ncbi:hypothetical protein BsWGS_24740 [Bradybaena similaris]